MEKEFRDAYYSMRTNLLRLYQSSCAIYTHNEAASDLRVKRATVPCFFDTQYPPYPCHDLVAGRVCWLVEVYTAVAHIFTVWALQRRVPTGNGRIVASAYIELVVVLKEQWPGRRVERRGLGFRLDHKIYGACSFSTGTLRFFLACKVRDNKTLIQLKFMVKDVDQHTRICHDSS